MKKILLFTSMLICLPVHTGWSKQNVLAYPMGDGDTKASSEAGTQTQVFSQGTLIQLALKNKDAFEEAKQTLQDELYGPILQTKVHAKVEAVEQDGDGYWAIIRVAWAAEQNRAFEAMNKFLVGQGPSKYTSNFEFQWYANKEGKGKSNLSPKIFQYIAEHPIFAKISIAGKEERLPVLFGSDGDSLFFPCSSLATLNYQGEIKASSLCFRNLKATDNDIDGTAASNPLRIYLTKEEAESATNVTALMEVYDEEAEGRKLKEAHEKEIDRLFAEMDRPREATSQKKHHKIITLSTQEYKYSAYLEAWRKKVERIGNINYPDEVKHKKLYGALVLHVAVRADGSIEQIRLLRSSGHKELDDAAIRIVRLAAPFSPFPPDIRKEVKKLDITRTWQFRSGNRLSLR